MELIQREQEIIRDLLAQQGILSYNFLLNAPEGRLPQGTSPKEVRAMSGSIVTSSKIYSFWLDWYDGHDTLDHEEGFWSEETLSELSLSDQAVAREMQRSLQQEEMNPSE